MSIVVVGEKLPVAEQRAGFGGTWRILEGVDDVGFRCEILYEKKSRKEDVSGYSRSCITPRHNWDIIRGN